jgi:hypothetical protein
MATKKKSGKKAGTGKGAKKKGGSKKKTAGKTKASSRRSRSSASSPGILKRAQNFVSNVLGAATETATDVVESAAETSRKAAGVGKSN